jgi:rRNA maturation endonuclease Nob1
LSNEVILEYDFCDIILGKIRLLNSEEQQRTELWFRKRVDTIRMQYPLAVLDYYTLEYDVLEKGIFKAYWASVEEAKKYANKLLSSHVIRYEQVPRVVVRVNVPEAKFPPEIQIARMKSQSYSDDDILKKAKALGVEENRAREIITDHINIQNLFDLKIFCSELKRKES